jgi:hypothetical protein
MKRLKQHKDLNVTYVEAEDIINCRRFKNSDALLFYSPNTKFSPYFKQITELDIPKFAMSGDAHGYEFQSQIMEEYGTDINYFFTNTEEYFYRFVPSEYKYRQIVIGVDHEEGYYNDVPSVEFSSRISNKILNSGFLNNRYHYILRKECNKLTYVNFVTKKDFLGAEYSKLLMQYKAAISASTLCFTLRSIEIAMAGCVPFLEVTRTNGSDSLGFTDGVNAIYINDKDYKDRLSYYIMTQDDPKWKHIAANARDFVLKNYTTQHGVNRLVNYIKENL